MKKIYLALLWAVSMVFASGADQPLIKMYSRSNSDANYERFFVYAKNEGNVSVSGFSFDMELTTENGQTPIVDVWYKPNATYTLEQKSSNKWILHFNVSGINFAPNAYFPNTSGFSFGIHYGNWSNVDASNDYAFADVGSNYGVNKKIPVYVNGEIVFGYPNDPSVWPKRIGVLKKHWDYACDEEVIIRLDAQDIPNQSGFDEGETVNVPSVYVGRGIVEFMYCVLEYDGTTNPLPRVPFDYAVLRLDDACPAGAQRFRRLHDTENSTTYNYSSGNIWPNVVNDVNRDVRKEFCFVPADNNSNLPYPVGSEYAVFANVSNANIVYSRLRVDDENTYNHNSWYWYGAPSNIQSRIMTNIVFEEDNEDTYYHIVQWVGPNILPKRTELANSEELISVDAPLSPVVRGIDHSAVDVEIKTAGTAKVSIVNANGAVVAKIVKENLQPGFHRVEWHSGIVPNGRYIVTVEQNGKTNAKSVILK